MTTAQPCPAPLMKTPDRFLQALLLALTALLLGEGAARATGPTLELQRAGQQLVLRWLVSSNSYQILQADDLTQPAQWRPLHAPVRIEGAFHQATVAMAGARGFFELLQTPYPLPPPEIFVTRHEDRFFLQWDAVPQAASYSLYLGTTPGVSKTNFLQVLPTATTFVEIEGLTPGTTYSFVATSVNPGGEGVESAAASGIFGANGDVSGRLYAVFGGAAGAAETYFLPGRPVFLSNTVSHATLPAQWTVRRGEFRFLSVPAGTWRVCWDFPGAEPGCGAAFGVSNGTVNLPGQLVLPRPGAIYGRVRLPSGDVPTVAPSPGYGIAPEVVVRSTDAAGNPLGFANVDNDGAYVLLPAVQCCPRLAVTASSENASSTTQVPEGFSGRLDFTLLNTPPVIERVFVAYQGRPTRRAPAGATVHLTVAASDADGDALTHNWSLVGHVPTARLPGLPTALPVTLPSEPGSYFLYVRVADGRGGYDRTRLEILTAPIVNFSGRVFCHQPESAAAGETPIANASVMLNNASVLTDADGYFTAAVPLASNYVLRIAAPGFVTFDRVFDDAVTDTDFALFKTGVFTAFSGAAGPIELTDPSGSELVIPPGALVDAAGAPYAGPVEVNFSSHDATADSVPFPNGSEVASPTGGDPQFIERLTLAHVEARVPGGAALRLAAGAAVELRLALPSSPAGGVPTNFPAQPTRCFYDATAHLWRTAGPATRTTNRAGVVFYASFLPSLGQITDVLPPKLTVNTPVTADRTLNFPFQVRVNNDALPQTVYDNSSTLRLGFQCYNRLRVISLKEGPGLYYEQFDPPSTIRTVNRKTIIVDKFFFANFGPVKLSLTNTVPKLQTVVNSDDYLDFPSSPDTAKPELGTAYYAAIKAPATFQQWKLLNGFPNSSNVIIQPGFTNYGSASAVYHNLTDLGFVRAMSMQKTLGSDGKTNLAYFVSNYATAEDAIAGTNLLATVCMDYALRPGFTKRFTRFYIYGKNNALIPAIDLDKGGGERAVPNLCVTCHGGRPAALAGGGKITPGDGDLGAQFIPFDLESYTYTQQKRVQLPEYAKLNQGILQTAPNAQIRNLILGWYGGTPGGSRTNFNKDYVEPTWAGQETLYNEVFKVSCRACHITRDPQSTSYFHSYKSFSDSAAASYACALIMPDSQRTFGIFWGSAAANVLKPGSVTNQPALLFQALGFDCP